MPDLPQTNDTLVAPQQSAAADGMGLEPQSRLPVMPASYVFGAHPLKDAPPPRDYGPRPENPPPYVDRQHPQGTTAIPPNYRPSPPVLPSGPYHSPGTATQEQTPASSPQAVTALDNRLKAIDDMFNWVGHKEGADYGTLYGNTPGWDGRLTTQGVPIINGQPWRGAVGPDGRPTHAFGKGQFEPATWVENVADLNSRGANIDVTKATPDAQKAVFRNIALKAGGPGVFADFEAGKLDELGQRLSGQWPSLAQRSLGDHYATLSPEMRAVIDQKRATLESALANDRAFIEEYHRQAMAEAPGSKERQALIDNMRLRELQYEEKWRELTTHPPVKAPVDMWKNFGSAATVVALLGGLFARNHMTAGLTAAGMAMQAINTNNKEEYERQYRTWREQTDLGLKFLELQRRDIDDLLADKKIDASEKWARLDQLFKEHGMMHADALLQAGQYDDVMKAIEATERTTNSVANQRLQIQQMNYQIFLKDNLDKHMPYAEAVADASSKAGISRGAVGVAKAGTEAEFIQNALHNEEQQKGRALTTAERGDVEKKAHADWAKSGAEGRGEAGFDLSQKIYGDETIGMVADSYIAGNDRAMVGMARQNVGAYAMARVWSAVATKLSAQEAKEFQEVYGHPPDADEQKVLDEDRGRRLAIAQAEFQGIRAGERTAFTRAASLVSAAAEAKQFTPQALETSAKVSRSEFKTFNAIQIAVQEHTGNKDVVDFHVANLSLADAFAQVIGRGNSQLTDAARAQAMSLLDKAWSEGQYETAVRRINLEIDAAQKAPEEVVKRFREGFLQRPFAAPTAPVGAEQRPRAAPAGLPPGAVEVPGKTYQGKPVYKLPDGQYYVPD